MTFTVKKEVSIPAIAEIMFELMRMHVYLAYSALPFILA